MISSSALKIDHLHRSAKNILPPPPPPTSHLSLSLSLLSFSSSFSLPFGVGEKLPPMKSCQSANIDIIIRAREMLPIRFPRKSWETIPTATSCKNNNYKISSISESVQKCHVLLADSYSFSLVFLGSYQCVRFHFQILQPHSPPVSIMHN